MRPEGAPLAHPEMERPADPASVATDLLDPPASPDEAPPRREPVVLHQAEERPDLAQVETPRERPARAPKTARKPAPLTPLASPEKHYEFLAPHRLRSSLLVLLVPLAAATAGGAALTAKTGSLAVVLVTAGAALLAVLDVVLLRNRPLRHVKIDGSVVTVEERGKVHRFDLTDPGVDISVRDGELALSHDGDTWLRVDSRTVDWTLFAGVVMHYQTFADLNYTARTHRMGA